MFYTTYLITTMLFSQNLFARTFGGTSYDEAYSITQTTDGGCAVAGHTESFGAGDRDFLVLKLAPNGSYPGCVEACSPKVGKPSLKKSWPKPAVSTPSLLLSSPEPTVTSPDLTITEACEPVKR